MVELNKTQAQKDLADKGLDKGLNKRSEKGYVVYPGLLADDLDYEFSLISRTSEIACCYH